VTLRDHPGVDGEVNRHRWARRWPAFPGLGRIRKVPDNHHHIVPAVIVVAKAVFASAGHRALAGFLAGCTGLTREAYGTGNPDAPEPP
jgi:hypothetical protein